MAKRKKSDDERVMQFRSNIYFSYIFISSYTFTKLELVDSMETANTKRGGFDEEEEEKSGR